MPAWCEGSSVLLIHLQYLRILCTSFRGNVIGGTHILGVDERHPILAFLGEFVTQNT